MDIEINTIMQENRRQGQEGTVGYYEEQDALVRKLHLAEKSARVESTCYKTE